MIKRKDGKLPRIHPLASCGSVGGVYMLKLVHFSEAKSCALSDTPGPRGLVDQYDDEDIDIRPWKMKTVVQNTTMTPMSHTMLSESQFRCQ